VTRPKGICNGTVIFAAGINVTNQQRDRRTCCFSFEHPRQNFNLIRLLALCNMAGCAGATAIEFDLNVLFRQQ